MAKRYRDYLPVDTDVTVDHQERDNLLTDLPKRVLPRTDVPSYLLKTPMQEQDRHSDSYHTNQPQARHMGHRALFTRPALADNLKMVERNLARGGGMWFSGSATTPGHSHLPPASPNQRKDDSAEPRVPYGDGTPLKGHPKD